MIFMDSHSSQNSKLQDNEMCNTVTLHHSSWGDGRSTVQGVWKLQQLLCWVPGCREFLLLSGSWLLISMPDISRTTKTRAMLSENLVWFSVQCCACWNIPIEFQQDFLIKNILLEYQLLSNQKKNLNYKVLRKENMDNKERHQKFGFLVVFFF